MTIILFLIDTSASMNQRTYLGTTLIDVAKGAVEAFMKLRSRDLNCRWDRYMLLTFESPPAHIKAGWKESHATLMSELRNIQATGLTSLGPALKNALDLLNINRMQSGVDAYGAGRIPYFLEPAVIIVITDGDRMTSESGIQTELHLPMSSTPVPGHELTKEPFRWDQRIFGLVLRIPASVPPDSGPNNALPTSSHPIDAMCEVTGGRSYAILSQKMLNSALESLVQKVVGGVVLHFEKDGNDPPAILTSENGFRTDNNTDSYGSMKENYNGNRQVPPNSLQAEMPKPMAPPQGTDWQNCRKLIIVPRSAQRGGYYVGHWPIPESYWPDPNNVTLPARDAQPTVHFTCQPSEPMVLDSLPFDKYELEACPLTRFILERGQSNVAWQVKVPNSGKYDTFAQPFGYLKPSSSLNSVNLFVMPFNYPVLIPLLDELTKVHKSKPPPKWRIAFDNYLKTVPSYYMHYLKKALTRMGWGALLPELPEQTLNYHVSANLKKIKNTAKVELDRLIASVGQKQPAHDNIQVEPRAKASILQRKDFNQLLQNNGNDLGSIKQELQDYTKFTVAVKNRSIQPQLYRNPYDIPRMSLLDQVTRMRTNFLQSKSSNRKLVDDDQMHTVAVQQMGNYQEYLKKQPPPLKELESQPVRLHTFGNPFKVKQDMMIDEADEAAFVGQNARSKRSIASHPSSPGPKRKKPGPLSRDVPIRRPSSPHPGSVSPVSSSESVYSDSDSENELMIIESDTEERESELVNGEQQLNNHHIFGSATDLGMPGQSGPTGYRAKGDMNGRKLALVHTHNRNLKVTVFKEVKRPGRNFERLFTHLNTVQGSLDTRKAFVEETILEAARFKRKSLVKMLEQFLQSMVLVEVKRSKQTNNISRSNQIVQR